MENVNIFELATKQKLRFESLRGSLSTEDLWDLPLSAKNGVDLDTTARAINRDLKDVQEESFVDVKPNPQANSLALKLEVLKHIIAAKQADNAAAVARANRAAERQRLTALLDKKNEQELEGLSKEDILKRIADLG
jgi:hypothetical protein